MAEKATICCQRVADLETPTVGSQQRSCARCSAAIWVSPSTLSAKEELGDQFEVACVVCLSQDESFREAVMSQSIEVLEGVGDNLEASGVPRDLSAQLLGVTKETSISELKAYLEGEDA